MKKIFNSWSIDNPVLKFDLKMKLTLFLLVCSLFQLSANNSYSQNTKLTLDMNEVTVNDVIREIESLSKFKFLYNRREIDLNRVVSVKVKKKRISKILKTLFFETSTSFEVFKEQIILKRDIAKELPNVSNEAIILQSSVSGTVTDAAGVPLPGASILEKGTANGTSTDFDGKYDIEGVKPDGVLVFSYLGYKSQEVLVDNQSIINVVMEEDASSLSEVVVIGYGVQRKSDLTGAITSVKAEDFTQGANYDASQLLNGAASGVNVSQVSSAPGAALKIQVRGAGSINSDNSVLFVVDGLPGVDPQSLSPGDIESIDILKDASSAAIYGTRAANGVVLITTKKGKAGKTSLTYSVYTGFQSVAKDLDVLRAQDYADLVNFRAPGTYTAEQIAGFGQGTNWQDQIFQNATVQNHQISLSGGSEKGNYYLGLNYFDQGGIVKSSSSKKYNIRLNLQSRPVDKLLLSVNANFTRQTNNDILFSNGANEGAGPINSAIQFDPTLSSGLDENGKYFLNPAIALDNPLALINGIDNQTVFSRFYASLNVDYEVVDNVTATLRLGGESNSARTDLYKNRLTIEGLGNGGSAEVSTNEYTHWLVEALLKYSNTWNDKHNFSILGGITLEEFLTRGLRAEAGGFLTDGTGTNLLQAGNGELNDNVFSSKFKNQLNGFIARATYDYEGKYFLTASFRVDGSSRFAPDNKYAFFPSGAIGWRLSKESFLEDNKVINDLKLRIGYGELGNQGINNFETRQTLVSSGSNSVFGGAVAQGVVAARLPNPDLKWETTKEINVGIDYALVNNRISGSIDYFNRKTSDQLFIKPLPAVVGFSEVRTNIGEVRNTGIDFSLRTYNIDKEDFKWNSNLTLSFLKNEVTELPDFTQEIVGGRIGTFISQYSLVREGEALQSFYGYEIDGIFQTGDDIAGSATPTFSPGMPRFVDQDGDGDVDGDDRVVLGDPFPDFTFGFNNSFKYKNFSLEIFLQGVQGIETLDANVTEALYPTNDFRNSISKYYTERWTASNPSNTFPSGENPSLYGGARAINSLTIVDASFIRLKNITLGYNVPVKDTWGISSLGLFIAADNLFTITDFDGYDPDASSEGLDPNEGSGGGTFAVARASFNSYPLARTIRLGFDIKF
ncbi:SusC/RagA family TonB-linked outer membrane protein [Flavivirga algicola]|uniref:TonB-dependent receptor n=1 Tax=Flavivirga algicola TaxID=2729136 RepID=A0ABX1RW46_9FLAO|nr:TonB-dependent receptor [Flavivirga algicola]NMH86898.1 TonB-dependent receptor [Flavivirga algicola]